MIKSIISGVNLYKPFWNKINEYLPKTKLSTFPFDKLLRMTFHLNVYQEFQRHKNRRSSKLAYLPV